MSMGIEAVAATREGSIVTAHVEFGLDTFGDVTVDLDGNRLSQAQTIRNLVEQGVLADELGLDFFGVGEHHRADFAVSSPETVLAAIAARTKQIKLGTAVTVLSSDDPVRVYQRFATVDAISGGRAEAVLGRGSFTESFPLFGFDLTDYNDLFEEKLALFAKLRDEDVVHHRGRLRPDIHGIRVYPTTEHKHGIPTWVGVGGSPESVVRTAKYGMRLMLAVIGGHPGRFAPYVNLFRQAEAQFGGEPQLVGIHSPGHVGATDAEAKEEFWEHYQVLMNTIGAERGWTPMTQMQFQNEVVAGSLYVGSPETVARRIATTVQTLGLDRFDLKYANGTLPHELMLGSIERYATQVVPMVRELLAEAADNDAE